MESLKRLEMLLAEYEELFFVGDEAAGEDYFSRIPLGQEGKRILLLARGAERETVSRQGIELRMISAEEYCKMEKLYYLYECSDRIHFLEKKSWYGSLEHYVSEDILTAEEALMVLQR